MVLPHPRARRVIVLQDWFLLRDQLRLAQMGGVVEWATWIAGGKNIEMVNTANDTAGMLETLAVQGAPSEWEEEYRSPNVVATKDFRKLAEMAT